MTPFLLIGGVVVALVAAKVAAGTPAAAPRSPGAPGAPSSPSSPANRDAMTARGRYAWAIRVTDKLTTQAARDILITQLRAVWPDVSLAPDATDPYVFHGSGTYAGGPALLDGPTWFYVALGAAP